MPGGTAGGDSAPPQPEGFGRFEHPLELLLRFRRGAEGVVMHGELAVAGLGVVDEDAIDRAVVVLMLVGIEVRLVDQLAEEGVQCGGLGLLLQFSRLRVPETATR